MEQRAIHDFRYDTAAVASSTPYLRYRPRFDMGLVRRLLGAAGLNRLTRSTQRRLELLYEPVLACLAPRVTWRTLQIVQRTDTEVLVEDGTCFHSRSLAEACAGADAAVCFVATVGRRVDAMIDRFMKQGNVADAYVVDAMGSGAAEHTAERFQDDFLHRFTSGNCHGGMRFSPGYCDWPVAEQEQLLGLLDGGALGVSLSDTALMTPRKSVSALFPLFPGSTNGRPEADNPCRRCSKTHCLARRPDEQSTTTPHGARTH